LFQATRAWNKERTVHENQKDMGREILDSHGNPTVEGDVLLTNGAVGRAAAPSGASTGAHETWELRDLGKKRDHGKGVHKAVDHVNRLIAPKLVSKNVEEQRKLDTLLLALDGAEEKKRLGPNAMICLSPILLVWRAALRRARPMRSW
jgi:enolase